MSRIIKPAVLEEYKRVFSDILFSRTDKITKITEGSVVNGVAFANAKLAQKATKDIALAQSHFYPNAAYGEYLDNIAEMYGISGRFSALGSSTYIRLVGSIGTVYTTGTQTFTGSNGIIFDLDETVTIGDAGFTYAKISSQSVGVESNVDPFTITDISPAPSGHDYVANEYASFGGRDTEDDESFRNRIKNAINELARGTIAMMEQVFMKINPKVLRVFNNGTNNVGQVQLSVLTQNGGDLSTAEIDELKTRARQSFTLTELNPSGFDGIGVDIINCQWYPVDISFRLKILPNYNPEEVRKEIQIKINKYFDYRTWVSGSKVEWDDLLDIVKRSEGVEYVYDNHFFPRKDLEVPFPLLPRPRGFLMLDSEGTLISNGTQDLNPEFYPSENDFSFWATVLANI